MRHQRIILLFVMLLACMPLMAEDYVVTSSEYITVSGNVGDSLGRTRLTPDSIRIVITDSAGTELHDAWYEAADAQAMLNGNVITFTDQWNDINGAASIGIFTMTVTIGSDAQNNLDLFSNYEYTIRGVTVSVEQVHNELAALLDSIQNHDDWVAQQSGIATSANQTFIIDSINAILDTLQLQDNWAAQESSLYDPASDSVIVDGSSLAATSGAITATTIATDAIGADEWASSAALENADTAWDAVLTGATHNIVNSAGRKLRDVSHLIVTEGTAQRGNSLGIVIASATSFADDVLNGNTISIIGGMGEGQSRHIHDYTGTTDSITLHDGDEWAITPDVSSEYVIEPDAKTDVIHMSDSAIADIWNDTTGFKAAGSRGLLLTYLDSLNKYDEWMARVPGEWSAADSTAYQGSASGLTAAEIIDSILALLTTDTTTNTLYAHIVRLVGTGGGSSNWSDAQRDSLLNVVQDGASGKDQFKATGFSTHDAAAVYTQFTSGSNEDAFKATGFSTHNAAAVWSVGTRTLTALGFALAAGDFGASSLDGKGDWNTTTPPTVGAIDTELSSNHGSGSWITGGGGAAPTVEEINTELTSSHGSGSWQSGSSGSGAYAVYVLYIDTSGIDDTLSGISGILQNQTGVRQAGPLVSGSDGYAGPYNVEDSVEVVPDGGAAYTFPTAGATITANDTIVVQGYNETVASPGSANYAAAYNTEYDVTGSAVSGIIVSVKRLTIAGTPGVDSTNNITLTDVLVKDTTDAAGFWSIDLLRTGQYTDTTVGFYFFEAHQGNRKLWQADSVYIGDTGNLNMTDWLAGWRY